MANNIVDPAEGTDAASSPHLLPHVSYTPLPASPRSAARQRRVLARMERRAKLPPWVKKISWVLFPIYGFMRLHDPDCEEHYEQYEAQQRSDYGA